MKTAKELLDRIRWDEHYAKSRFKIGYYDRVEDRIIIVPFKEIHFPKDSPSTFLIVDDDGEVHSVPYHRVKSIYRDNALIWHRDH
jgi:uncharacterized protein (UPF0248 family)